MDIKNSKFITSLSKYDDFAGPELSQIAIVGKSNVGKSSLINSLCRHGKLSKISSTPGKTRLINVFEATVFDDTFEQRFQIIDLPGYGYAKVSNVEKLKWANMIENYLLNSSQLLNLFHLVDIRHDPTQDDVLMNEFIRSNNLNFTTIATKADKISRSAYMRNISSICRKLQVQPWEIISYSSETCYGRDSVIKNILTVLKA